MKWVSQFKVSLGLETETYNSSSLGNKGKNIESPKPVSKERVKWGSRTHVACRTLSVHVPEQYIHSLFASHEEEGPSSLPLWFEEDTFMTAFNGDTSEANENLTPSAHP